MSDHWLKHEKGRVYVEIPLGTLDERARSYCRYFSSFRFVRDCPRM
jgi:hypothetical protein